MSIPWLLKIISGRKTGPLAASIRGLLWCFTPLYRVGVWYRNGQYDTGLSKIESVPAKVISIGNITTGGTGKTPMVIWVCNLLAEHNIPTGIVSRGYGAVESELPNDEAMELHARLPNVPHQQDPNRVEAANRCIEEHSVGAIVLDDGFQHRRLDRNLDIVLIDASNPFGHGYLIPRGLLREPAHALKRADVVVITRCDRVDEKRIKEVNRQIQRATRSPIVLGKTMPMTLVDSSGTQSPLSDLKNGNGLVFSAIGNHEAFEASVTDEGCNVVGTMQFRDHHIYKVSDHDALSAKASQCSADFFVCTHKDLVKLQPDLLDLPVFALQTELQIFEGEETLRSKILELFAPLKTLE